MKSLKMVLGVCFAISACIGVSAFATDTSGAAQLDTTIPPPDGAIPADQIPPISSKPNMNNNTQGAPGQAASAPQAMTPTAGNPPATTTPPASSAGSPPAPVGQPGTPIGAPNAMVGTPAAPNSGAASNPPSYHSCHAATCACGHTYGEIRHR